MTIFYEVLMEKQAKKDEEDGDRALGALGGIGATIGTGIAGVKMQHAGHKKLMKSVKDDPEGLKRLISKMGGTTNDKGEIFLKAKNGRKIKIDLNAAPGNAYYNPIDRMFKRKGKPTGGELGFGKGFRDHDVFFHELGHATGAGSKPKNMLARHGLQGGAQMIQGVTGGLGALTGLAGAGYAGAAKNKEEADKANRIANASLLASGLATVPTLAEEARASIRARGLAKKFGKGLKGGRLIPAYGTYLGGALAMSSPAIAAKALAKYKQHKYRDEKNASARLPASRYQSPTTDDKKTMDFGDHLTTAQRGITGGTVGGALAGMSLAGARSMSRKEMSRIGSNIMIGGALGATGGLLYDRYDRKKRGIK